MGKLIIIVSLTAACSGAPADPFDSAFDIPDAGIDASDIHDARLDSFPIRPPVFDTGGPRRDSGTDAQDAGTLDTGMDTGTPDTGPRDAGALDTGTPDTGTDAGPPDTGAPDTGADAGVTTCTTTQRVTFNPGSPFWDLREESDSHRAIRITGNLYRLAQYKVGITAVADDPRALVRIIVQGCELTVFTCADQNDIDRQTPYPLPGHGTCQVDGTGYAAMGLACSFDNPPMTVDIVVSHFLKMDEDDPAYCSPGVTVAAFATTNPAMPSMF